VGQPTFNPARTRLTHGLSEPVEFNPLLKKLNFSQPNPARTRGDPSWLTGWNPFWHLYYFCCFYSTLSLFSFCVQLCPHFRQIVVNSVLFTNDV